MQGFTGGIEDYGDSMASHYLMEEPDDPVKYPETKSMPSADGKHTTVIGLGKNRTKLKPADIDPTDISVQRRRVFPGQPEQPHVRAMRQARESVALDARRANAKYFVGETPNVEKPLSPEKQARIPIHFKDENDLAAMKQNLAEYDRPQMFIDKSVKSANITPEDIADEEARKAGRAPIKSGTKKGKIQASVNERLLGAVHVEPRFHQRGVDPRTGDILTDAQIGNMEFNQAKSEAWSYLRSAPGTPEKTSGTQRGGFVYDDQGRLVRLTGRSGADVKDIEPSGRAAVPGRTGTNLPPTQAEEADPRKKVETRSAVLPGYDPKGEKGLFEGHEDLQELVAKNLSKMDPVSAVGAGALIEHMAKMAGRGNTTAIDRSLEAGRQLTAAISRSRQAAQGAHANRVAQMQRMQETTERNRSLRKANEQGRVLHQTTSGQAEAEALQETEGPASTAQKPASTLFGPIAPKEIQNKRVSRKWKTTTPEQRAAAEAKKTKASAKKSK